MLMGTFTHIYLGGNIYPIKFYTSEPPWPRIHLQADSSILPIFTLATTDRMQLACFNKKEHLDIQIWNIKHDNLRFQIGTSIIHTICT